MPTHQSLGGASDEQLLLRMITTHSERYGQDYWAAFDAGVAPHLPASPVVIDSTDTRLARTPIKAGMQAQPSPAARHLEVSSRVRTMTPEINSVLRLPAGVAGPAPLPGGTGLGPP